MNKYELDKTVKELNEIAGIPGNEVRAMELAKALVTHYKGEDKPEKDERQLELQFQDD